MRFLLLLLTCFAVVAPALAGPLEEAADAERRGDDATALLLLRPLADAGNAEAQLSLGTHYEFGFGVSSDAQEAAKWYRKAAEQGLLEAQFNLGFLYVNGQGVPRDVTKAALWYGRAAERGSILAQYSIGVLYERGQGVAKDRVQALKWLLLAADRVAPSQKELAADIAKARDRVAADMTPQQVAEAEAQMRDWKAVSKQ